MPSEPSKHDIKDHKIDLDKLESLMHDPNAYGQSSLPKPTLHYPLRKKRYHSTWVENQLVESPAII